MTLGAKLKRAREIFGYTQEDIEEGTGIPQATVSRWENDHADMRMSNLRVMAKFYDTAMADLLEGVE